SLAPLPQSLVQMMRSTPPEIVTVTEPLVGASAGALPPQVAASSTGMLLGAVHSGSPAFGSQLSAHGTASASTKPSPASLQVSMMWPKQSRSPAVQEMVTSASGWPGRLSATPPSPTAVPVPPLGSKVQPHRTSPARQTTAREPRRARAPRTTSAG